MRNTDERIPGEIIEKHWKPAENRVAQPMTDRKSSLNAMEINCRDPPSSLIPSHYLPGAKEQIAGVKANFRKRNASVSH
jgi:hypothetical protein